MVKTEHICRRFIVPIILFVLPFIINNNANAVIGKGKLEIINKIYSYLSQGSIILHSDTSGVSEGYDSKDHLYHAMFDPSGISSKMISEVGVYELDIDKRPTTSTSTIYLELSLHSQSGSAISVSDVQNELWCDMPLTDSGYDFGTKPITLWKRNLSDPNESYFMADIREAVDKSNYYPLGFKTAVIPLAPLDGIYGSEVPYMYTQVRFNTFPGDFNLDGKVNLEDFSYLGKDWMTTDVNSIADISGPNGLPDKNVDIHDLSLFARDWLKDSNDPNTWRDFPYEYP